MGRESYFFNSYIIESGGYNQRYIYIYSDTYIYIIGVEGIGDFQKVI